jgi:exodeoxyribonuclease VII large subunit
MSPTVYSVAEITAYIKARFMEDALLGDVWLSGEVSNFKLHTSGHCYLTLKDATSEARPVPGGQAQGGFASIKAVIWRTTAARLTLPRDGDAVMAHGYISVYEPQGAYQFYIDQLQLEGSGRLWAEFERLRARLEAEGLFAAERKRPIPRLPRRLGVVTSPTGAALRDILRTLATRFPLVEVLLAPAQVQGDAAARSIVAAIEALNALAAFAVPLDAIILARGGGSIEDLWPFNDESVARAIAGSQTPVVTGIGHETDFTIADFVADLRAPTPTGAAALIVPEMRELRAAIDGLGAAAAARTADRLAAARSAHDAMRKRLERASPGGRLAGDRQRVDDLMRRAQLAAGNRLSTLRERLAGQGLRLGALDPAGVLARGYAIVTATPAGTVVISVGDVGPGDALRVRVSDGAFGARVTGDA